MKHNKLQKDFRNFVAHASQTVRHNGGRHKNIKREHELKGRHSKHKINYKNIKDYYIMLLIS